MNDETLGRHTVILSTCKILLVEDLYLYCSNSAQSAIIWCNWVLLRSITIQTSLVGCLHHMGSPPDHHHTNTTGGVFTLHMSFFPATYHHSTLGSVRCHTEMATWILHPCLISVFVHRLHDAPHVTMHFPAADLFVDAVSMSRREKENVATINEWLSVSSHRVFHPRPSPTELAPYLLRRRRSHLRIFYTSKVSITDYFESYRRANTLLSERLLRQQYCIYSRQLHIRVYRCANFFWHTVSLRGSPDMSNSYGSHSTSDAAVPESPSRHVWTVK